MKMLKRFRLTLASTAIGLGLLVISTPNATAMYSCENRICWDLNDPDICLYNDGTECIRGSALCIQRECCNEDCD